MYSINKNSVLLLREKIKDDATAMLELQNCIQSFMEYSSRIYKLEIYRQLFNYDNISREDFQQEVISLDQSRTASHNTVISNINILNRLCKQSGIPLIYEGVVSIERPYRVEIADVVLAYVAQVIETRQK